MGRSSEGVRSHRLHSSLEISKDAAYAILDNSLLSTVGYGKPYHGYFDYSKGSSSLGMVHRQR
jgi:hypothetical protein